MMTTDEITRAIARHNRWYHRIELAPGIITPGINDSDHILSTLDLPDDMHGMRVLDIGARDGYFSFVCERRGAEVIAVDYLPAEATGFAIASTILGSRVTFVQDNIYKLRVEQLGTFDLVLMLGLLYHLRDPLGAIDLVRDLCSKRLLLETHVCDDSFMLSDNSEVPLARIDARLERAPIMRFCPGNALNADHSNYWSPNTACVESMLREAAFEVRRTVRLGNRSVIDSNVTHDATVLYHRAIARGDIRPSA